MRCRGRGGSAIDNISIIRGRLSIVQVAQDGGLPIEHRGGRYFIPCIFHQEKTPSAELYPDQGKGFSHCCKRHFDVFDLWGHIHNCDNAEAIRRLTEQFGLNEQKQQKKINATYDYTDESGKLLYQAIRLEPKGFYQRRSDDKGGWINNLQDVEPVPYRLRELLQGIQQGETVYISEGEKDCNSLAAMGLVATTNSGGAGKWTEYHSKHFPTDADVVILPDNDEPGRKHAKQVAGQLHGRGCRVRVVNLPGLAEKGDVSDWLAARHTKEELLHIVGNVPYWSPEEKQRVTVQDGVFTPINQEPEEWQEVIPLSEYDVPVFPVDALPVWLKDFVISLSDSVQTPVDLAGMLSLSVLAACIAKKAVVSPIEGWLEPLNLYTVTALPPASRKSAVFAECTAPIIEYERSIIDEQKANVYKEQSEYKVLEQALQQAQSKKAKALADGKDIEYDTVGEIAEKLSSMEVPILPRLLLDDATMEIIPAVMAEQDGKIAIMSAEGDLFDIAGGRYNSGSVNIGILLKGHSGDFIRVDRIGRGAVVVDNPALTIGLAVQPDVLRGLVQNKGFRGRGLLGRFLYSLPESNIGHRNVKTIPINEMVKARYRSRITDLLDIKVNDSVSAILFDSDSKNAFSEYCEYCEASLADNGELSSISDWGGKLCGAVARIAGLLHIADNVTDWDKKRIPSNTIKNAITIGHYLIDHARAAFDLMGGNEDLESAKTFLAWIERTNRNTFSKRDLFEAVKGSFPKVELLNNGLTILIERGFIRECALTVGGRGRKPSILYEVNPKCYSLNSLNSQKSCSTAKNLFSANTANCAKVSNSIDLMAGEF